jgi:hypothetical protein
MFPEYEPTCSRKRSIRSVEYDNNPSVIVVAVAPLPFLASSLEEDGIVGWGK